MIFRQDCGNQCLWEMSFSMAEGKAAIGRESVGVRYDFGASGKLDALRQKRENVRRETFKQIETNI